MEPAARTLGGRYELRSLIASGGMGQVWRAHDQLLGRAVAVKVLRSEYAGDPAFLGRFRAEARHTALLHHPAVTSVFDYGETDASSGEHLAYLVMELVEGESLADLVRREGALDPARALEVLRATASGLAAAHEVGVVHRDVKPGNVLVGWDGAVSVTDFGIAWSASSVSLTDTGQVIGTAHYLSPEQAEGRPATPASDVYALGMVGYELLSGRKAFQGESSVAVALSQIREEPPPLPATVPAPVQALIAAMTTKDPRARLADGDAVVAAIDRLPAAVREDPTLLLPTTASVPVADEPGSRRRRPLVLALLAGAVLLAGVGVAVLLGVGGTEATADAGPAPSAASTTTAAAPTTAADVVLTAGDLLGRPADEVVAELTALGLAVTRAETASAQQAAGTVLAVDPTGTPLAPGSAVTVTAAVAPPTESPGLTTVGGTTGSGAEGVPVVPTAEPAPTTAAPAPAPGPGNGNGNDNGNGPGNGNGNGPGGGGPGNGNGPGGGRDDEDD
ncbi:hypothetical protein ASG36_09100 [Geodermatophilus sp. Leaf369]|uniref:protein kinase domain-containing protein n=1 Tax=Geodermatophilus sp. Leaf369 TaxID=1736354 RepID=UPI00070216CA|nr:protein kinase [Geodermatophilus sp. Leaf369]KQS58259.1 hypothetical protein ASG36_09100 [Geodermatophilus sp. Leaf369]